MEMQGDTERCRETTEMNQQHTPENTGLKYTQSNQGMGNRRETQLGEIRANETGAGKTEYTDTGLGLSKQKKQEIRNKSQKRKLDTER